MYCFVNQKKNEQSHKSHVHNYFNNIFALINSQTQGVKFTIIPASTFDSEL